MDTSETLTPSTLTTPTYWGEIILVLERINITLEHIYEEVAAIPKVKGNRL